MGALITTMTHSRAVLAKGKYIALGTSVVGDAAGTSPSSRCHPTVIPAHLPQALLPASARVRQPLAATSSATMPGWDANTFLTSSCGV